MKLFAPIVAAALLVTMMGRSVVYAHTEEQAAANRPETGIEERLGKKIRLDVAFRDENGKTVSLADLVSGPTIILPVYYSCTNVCNFLQAGLAKALPEIRFKPVDDYRVISVSFDETETPELAARYKKTYLTSIKGRFPEDGWRFLTGDSPNILRLTESAGYRFERKGRDFIHPVASIVVAGDGTIVRYLYGTDFLPKDLSLAIIEAREGKVGETVRKVVGFCFSFDPEKKSYVFNILRVSATAIFLTAGGFLAFLILGGKKRRKNRAEKA